MTEGFIILDPVIITIPWATPPKRRPRFANGHAYSTDVSEEHDTGVLMLKAMKHPLEGDVGVAATFWRATHHRVDVDNLLKHILDAGNGILYEDDRQVKAISGVIRYDPTLPQTEVIVGSLKP